jgi:GntR family transcriptional regulator, transcriptional repressor for pyruvate dehydrogenase complex
MFKAIQPSRISSSIMDQIKEAVFQNKLMPGDKLPSEHELMEQFNASRVTIREALRTLEYSGIVEIKRGARGGAFIKDQSSQVVTNFLQDMFATGKIKIADLTEVRLVLEPLSAKVAASRVKESSLKEIGLNLKEDRNLLEKGELSDARLCHMEFHRLIAQASGNQVIFFMVDSMMDVLEHFISSIPLSPKVIEQDAQSHERIFFAIKNGQAKTARDLMLRDVQDIQTAYKKAQPRNISIARR